MKVSLITVAYNSEKCINHCINSVLGQDYDNIEYIVIDGGSTDKTLKIIMSHEDRISNLVSEVDEGIYDAINKGINLSTGEIVGILNSDDFFSDTNVISRVVEAFTRFNVEAVYADVDFIDNNFNIVRHFSSKYFRPWMFLLGFQPAHPTFYCKRANFEKYGYYRTELKIAGDFELLLRFLYKRRLSYKYIQDTWVNMRTGGVSTSGLRSVFMSNAEILKACTINGVKTGILILYSKYLIKWWGFVFKNKR